MFAKFFAPSRDDDSVERLRDDFLRMSLSFSVAHGSAMTLLVYASSLLSGTTGFTGNACFYAVTIFSAILLAAPVVQAVGLRGGLVWGLSLYTLYVGLFAMALQKDVRVEYATFVLGSILGGLGAGLLWTSQGGYMSRMATRIAALANEPRVEVTASLASQFATTFLGGELVLKTGFAVLGYFGLREIQIGMLYTVLCILATVLLLTVAPAEVADEDKASPTSKLWNAVKLWPDLRLWLLAPTNIAFGFTSAFMTGYFTVNYVKPEVGKNWIGCFSSCALLTGALLSPVYGSLSTKYGKGLIIYFGAFSFLAIPVILRLGHCCHGWASGMAMFYFFLGSGRAVYESTNKALFVDVFQRADEAEGAFSNCIIQFSLSSAFAFFCFDDKSETYLLHVIVISAFAVLLAYPFLCAWARQREQPDERSPLAGAADRNSGWGLDSEPRFESMAST